MGISLGMGTEASSGATLDAFIVDMGGKEACGWSPSLGENVTDYGVVEFPFRVSHELPAQRICNHVLSPRKIAH